MRYLVVLEKGPTSYGAYVRTCLDALLQLKRKVKLSH